ncbi:MAG: type II toxin-antitoxin system RelE/ParE family toxin [Caulobacteraceae bacterium]
MKIVRTLSFNRAVKKLGASEADLKALEVEIAAHPEAGDVIKGLSGARKLRFPMGGKGKRGGGRAIYIVVWVHDTALLITAYSKSVQENISAAQRDAIAALIEELNNG